jgi:hypothetical protein
MDGIAVHFIGKIAVIGNIAGTRIFELPNQNVGYAFNMSSHASIMNTVRKNISLLSRNIDNLILEDPNSSFDFMIEKDNDYVFSIGDTWPASKKSIIVT